MGQRDPILGAAWDTGSHIVSLDGHCKQAFSNVRTELGKYMKFVPH